MGHTIGSAVSTGQYDPAEHAVVLDEPMGQYVASGHDCGVGAGERQGWWDRDYQPSR